jgi:hypothetical protein
MPLPSQHSVDQLKKLRAISKSTDIGDKIAKYNGANEIGDKNIIDTNVESYEKYMKKNKKFKANKYNNVKNFITFSEGVMDDEKNANNNYAGLKDSRIYTGAFNEQGFQIYLNDELIHKAGNSKYSEKGIVEPSDRAAYKLTEIKDLCDQFGNRFAEENSGQYLGSTYIKDSESIVECFKIKKYIEFIDEAHVNTKGELEDFTQGMDTEEIYGPFVIKVKKVDGGIEEVIDTAKIRTEAEELKARYKRSFGDEWVVWIDKN